MAFWEFDIIADSYAGSRLEKLAIKILFSFPGNLHTVPMNRFVQEALCSLGHEVKAFNFGYANPGERLLKAFSKGSLRHYKEKQLRQVAASFRPTLFLTVFGFSHTAETLDALKNCGAQTACWWLNDPFQLERSLKQAHLYDIYFTNARGSLPAYREAGVSNVHFLPVAAAPKVHRRIEHTVKKHKVCFAGDWGKPREEILLRLEKKFPVKVFGPWAKKLGEHSPLRRGLKDGFFTPERMTQIFNESEVVLNIHAWRDRWDYGVNPRLFEANGCGAFQLCDWKEEIADLYIPDEEIVLYRTLDELEAQLEH